MAPGSQPERPSELVYLPEPSWAPILAAAGLALIVAGLAIGWVLSVIGLLFFVPAAVVLDRRRSGHRSRGCRAASAPSPRSSRR